MAEGGLAEEEVCQLSSMMAEATVMELAPIEILRKVHRAIKSQKENFKRMHFDPLSMANFKPSHVHVSTTPLKDLRSVTLRDLLRQPNAALGSCMVVRILDPAIQTVGWYSVIEDQSGDGCYFHLYNYPPRELFCVGTILIIKEPVFKMNNDGYQFIRCDCPTDIIVVNRSHKFSEMVESVNWVNELFQRAPHETSVLEGPLTASANEWKDLGNGLLRDGRFSLAREAYQLGLMRCSGTSDPTWRVLQSNMTAVYLELGYYEAAIATFELIPDDKNALFRAGRAHYQLKSYEQSEKEFLKYQARYPEEDRGGQELARVQRRLEERRNGYSSVNGLAAERRRDRLSKLDHADYIGPLKVVEIAGKGRGVVLTKNVRACSILVVSKAFAATLNPDISEDYFVKLTQTLDCNGGNLEIVSDICRAIAQNPRTFGPMIYELSTNEKPEPPFQIYCDPDTKDEPISDVKRIKAICECNNFYISSTDDGTIGAGLFVFPSYINHSCEPNAECTFYNDVMVIRSTKRLRAGDEVCVSYIPKGCSDQVRRVLLGKRGFTCVCPLCQPPSATAS